MVSDIRKNFTLFEDSSVLSSGPHDKSSTKVKNTEHWWYDITAQKNPSDCFRKTARVMVCAVIVAGHFIKRDIQINFVGKLQNFFFIKRSTAYNNQWAKRIEIISFRELNLCTCVPFFVPASLIRKMRITPLSGGMDICLL
jgi:hypothetical protein